MLHHQQPQHDLNPCAWAARVDRARPTVAQITFDLLEDLIVFEQPIQFAQLRFEAQLQRWYQEDLPDEANRVVLEPAAWPCGSRGVNRT